ncbi:hypothetical protein C1Y63_10645 [Corynebacterium sp. 13CS0277]|uniref:hypothetical protein n=1 Tax=Corynebacterium sp. 13CS0277 TaxID=2071994 RepID=UPI000D0230DE|nr:hypothetical protein [Corynebacterium sp. 13CS0277]PRQ10642.1 hypothetical protein C1Y63_10645 [Corynebacterium sp. 13CS0277]
MNNRIQLLTSTPVLRAVLYGIMGLTGAGAVVAGVIDPTTLNSWVDRAPAIAATLGSILALANIHPQPTPAGTMPPQATPTPAPAQQDPTAEYAARLLADHRE